MTEYDHYLFDLNGYLVLKGALSPELVAAMNEAIDQHRDRINIRGAEQTLDGSLKEQGGRAAEGLKGTHGRGDFGGYLFWESPWRQPFLDAIALPHVMRVMLATIGPRFRLVGSGHHADRLADADWQRLLPQLAKFKVADVAQAHRRR